MTAPANISQSCPTCGAISARCGVEPFWKKWLTLLGLGPNRDRRPAPRVLSAAEMSVFCRSGGKARNEAFNMTPVRYPMLSNISLSSGIKRFSSDISNHFIRGASDISQSQRRNLPTIQVSSVRAGTVCVEANEG